MNAIDVSVVIGYKDWGKHRLIGAVRSVTAALEGIAGEVVVSDYGSVDSDGYQAAIEAEGAVYVRTETNGVWSRSRALNAGLREARGKILVTTDADMVFSPGTFAAVERRFAVDPQQYVVMQCNDLPEGIDHDDIESGRYSWSELSRLAKQRPRWGMGGMIAFSRAAYYEVRGLDERMEIYGGEDIDLARRLRRLGLKLTWLDEANGQMFHVWHASSRASADQTEAGRAAIALNRSIQLHDRTIARNLTEWQFAPAAAPPLVTVVISTCDRAAYLGDAIRSVLAQSMRDFELIVVDDGSTDATSSVVKSFADPRILYVYQDRSGIAVARNYATSIARGKYVAVMDDDDLMMPTRLEDSLNAIVDGANGAYGGWIDFDEESGRLALRSGKRLSLEALLFNGGILAHATILIERRWLQAVPYDESFRSGSDYNLAVRLVRSGAKLNHSGQYVLMRRLHAGQITATDSPIQKTAGTVSGFWGRASMIGTDVIPASSDREAKDKVETPSRSDVERVAVELLPDNVVTRRAVVRSADARASLGRVAPILERGVSRIISRSHDNAILVAEHEIEDVKLDEVLQLREAFGGALAIQTRFRADGRTIEGTGAGGVLPGDWREVAAVDAVEFLCDVDGRANLAGCVVVVASDRARLRPATSVLEGFGRVIGYQSESSRTSQHALVCPLDDERIDVAADAVWNSIDRSAVELTTISGAKK